MLFRSGVWKCAHFFNINTVNIDTTDPDNLLRKELDRIPLDTTEKILLTYRAYLSDDLTEPQAVQVLQVESINYNRGTATLSAIAPKLNVNRTGELYTFSRFPVTIFFDR